MAIYKIFLNNKKRIPNSFNKLSEAEEYISNLKDYANKMILKGQYHFHKDLREIRKLEIVEIKTSKDKEEKIELYSVIEVLDNTKSVIQTFSNPDMANDFKKDILVENSKRTFEVINTILRGE